MSSASSSSSVHSQFHSALKYFHDHFRSELASIQKSLANNKTNKINNKFIRSLHSDINNHVNMLHLHHSIEDKRIFPFVVKKIPEFKELEKQHGQLEKILNSLTKLCEEDEIKEENYTEHAEEISAKIEELAVLVLPHMRTEEELLDPAKTQSLFTESDIRKFF
jgi:hemerythrin-like domain-containing protein